MKSKIHPASGIFSSTLDAFTLLELLVVITIIGVLAGLSIPTGDMVMKTMRKMEASKTATELRTAMMNYFSEYKRFPTLEESGGVQKMSDGHSDGDTEVETSGDSGLISALMAEPDNQVAEKLNRRGVQFFSAAKAKQKPESQKGPGGLWKEGDQYELFDPWGNYYHIMFDSNGNGVIKPPSKTDGSSGEELMAEVAVWSYGPDHEAGKGGNSKKNDDVYTY